MTDDLDHRLLRRDRNVSRHDVLSRDVTEIGVQHGLFENWDAALLGQEDNAIYEFIHDAMSAVTGQMELNDLVAMALKTGEVNIRAMELLDAGMDLLP